MKTFLVTGSNRGIGLELCKQLSEQGQTVFAACRHVSKELEQLPVTVIKGIDFTEKADIQKLVDTLAEKKLDVLINNAGVWGGDELEEVEPEKTASVIAVNAIAPLVITQQLLLNLHTGSKVIMITSRVGSIEDNSSGGNYSYRMSKAALNAAAKSLSIDLKEKGIIIGIIHPGHVATDMGGPRGMPVNDSVTNILKRIEEYSLDNTGVFKHMNGKELPW